MRVIELAHIMSGPVCGMMLADMGADVIKVEKTPDGDDYKPGDIVAWALADGRPHIRLVTERRSSDGERPLVMHNISSGPHVEDKLFEYKIIGHYRYDGGLKADAPMLPPDLWAAP